MAETYKVGQYRYTGDASVTEEPCVQLLNTYPENSGENDDSYWLEPVYRDANFLIGGKKCCYQDVLIPLCDSNKQQPYKLQPGEVYYIELDLAKTSASTNYILKLVNKDQSPDFSDYEVLKRFTTPECENAGLKPVRLVLYTTSDDITDRNQFSVAVVDENLGELTQLSSTQVQGLEYKNEVQLIPSWIIDVNEKEKYHYDSFVSTNYYESVFDSLLLEIFRDENDKDLVTTIQSDWIDNTNENEEPTLQEYDYILGRWLNVDKPKDETNKLGHLDIKLYKINKILPGQNETIKKIGVWGRPGLVMAINGQRIEIGPSGVFEFEGLDITSFGVFAEGIEDKFVVDYQYTKDITL